MMWDDVGVDDVGVDGGMGGRKVRSSFTHWEHRKRRKDFTCQQQGKMLTAFHWTTQSWTKEREELAAQVGDQLGELLEELLGVQAARRMKSWGLQLGCRVGAEE